MRDLCWSANTHKSRRSQWKKFFKFCQEYSLCPLPASPDTVGLYITYLTRSCCYVTIENYLSGIWALHDYWGFEHVDPTVFIIRATLRGAKRLLGCESTQATPISPSDLQKMYSVLDLSKFKDYQLWCAIILAYRCLLRVGHVTVSPHSMLVKDLHFNKDGMDVSIRSSKTIQYKERLLVVPVVSSGSSILCPCAFLRDYIRTTGLPGTSMLFPYTYGMFSTKLKKLCSAAGLVGKFSTHSLRRGSASFLSTFLPLHDIKVYGDWKSMSVLLYLSDDYSTRKTKDVQVATRLSAF